ncbi:hypothetical protein [Pseudoxanthomonas sp. JBR18]|uniref:hypothetical protein n=1 Tax=Pseudoxanthomonas sp. JBR18 TaxID=2969308 RepID=UPI002305F5DB|nr:hypothetical protein [Pseudoxanthomonas sp. JBR18]WCE04386.1 hypothetical protein PJ250_20370 [Pseudoxanthomonas sp. JBR18]
MHASWKTWLLALSCASPAIAQAQVEMVESRLYYQAEPATGFAYRDDVGKATKAMLAGDMATAAPLLERAIKYCDAQRNQPGRKSVSFSSRREYEQYMEGPGKGQPTEWLDIACASAYQQAGYALAGARRPAEALTYLEIATQVGPYYPVAWTEKGFVLNQLGQPAQALEAYTTALEVARAHPEAAYVSAVAWRGIGYSKVELKDLEGGREAYQQSLQLEPGNATAVRELDYIAQRQATGNPPAP